MLVVLRNIIRLTSWGLTTWRQLLPSPGIHSNASEEEYFEVSQEDWSKDYTVIWDCFSKVCPIFKQLLALPVCQCCVALREPQRQTTCAWGSRCRWGGPCSQSRILSLASPLRWSTSGSWRWSRDSSTSPSESCWLSLTGRGWMREWMPPQCALCLLALRQGGITWRLCQLKLARNLRRYSLESSEGTIWYSTSLQTSFECQL